MDDAGCCKDRFEAVPVLKTAVVLVTNVVTGPVVVVVLAVADFAFVAYCVLSRFQALVEKGAFLVTVDGDATVE